MTCWHCNKELDINYQAKDFSFKFYHCSICDSWYEMRKEKAKLNAAVPVRFYELQTPPQIPLAV
jgi:transcription elongation factor Elf1